jgi:hypothetical protein
MVFLADSAMLCRIRMVHSQATRNGEKDERKQPGTALHGDGSRYLVNYSMLVGGLEYFVFFHIWGIIIPTDSYFSEG